MRCKKRSSAGNGGAGSRLIALAVIGVLAIGCSPIAISLDYDARVDFRNYKTFDWLDNRLEVPDAVKAAVSQDPFVSDSVRDAVGHELVASGLSRDQVDPDLLAFWHVGRSEAINVERYGYAYAAQYGAWGGEIDRRFYREGTLVLDLVDATTMHLVWRSVATGAMKAEATPDELKNDVREAAKKLLSAFPPAP